MRIKATLHNRYKKKDGTCRIKLYVYVNAANEWYVPTEYHCREDQFNEDEGLVKKNRPNYEHINAELNRKKNEIESDYLKGKKTKVQFKPFMSFKDYMIDFKNNAAYTRDVMSGKIQPDKTKKILVSKKGKSLSDATLKSYPTYINYILSFFEHEGHNYTYDEIDLDFFQDMVSYLRFNYEIKKGVYGLAENSIAKAVKTVQLLLERTKKHHNNKEYRDFSMGFVETDNIALTEEEIQKIIDVDLTEHPHLMGERDRFLVAYNFLLRFTDSLKIKESDIVEKDGDRYFTFRTGKTKESVVIPVFKMTYSILQGREFALSRTTNQESNWKIKEIGRLAGIDQLITVTEYRKGTRIDREVPKYEEITSHTTRRSGSTNMYIAGVPLKIIQLLGGWKSIIMLERYLKIDKLQNALAAAKHEFFKSK